MGLGVGILLLVVGLILVFNVFSGSLDSALNLHSQHTLGWILVVVGVIAIILSLVVNQQRTRQTTVVDDRRNPPVV